MLTTSNANQLSATPQETSRVIDLRVWMIRNGVTFVSIGKALGGITGNAVHQLLKGERVSSDRHADLRKFGIPEHLLPPALDVPRGRPTRK